MLSKLCCTAPQPPRADSPDLPNARIPALGRRSSCYEQLGSGSAFSSTRIEERQALQRIFENASRPSEESTEPDGQTSKYARECGPTRQANAVNRLRKRLSKIHSRSLLALRDDGKEIPLHVKCYGPGNDAAKHDPHESLLGRGSRNHAMYDPDAISIHDVQQTPKSNILRAPSQVNARSSVGSIEWKCRPDISPV